MDDDIVMLRRGDPCPLCGQPIQTYDERSLNMLTLLREYLDVTATAGAAISHLRHFDWGGAPDDETEVPENG